MKPRHFELVYNSMTQVFAIVSTLWKCEERMSLQKSDVSQIQKQKSWRKIECLGQIDRIVSQPILLKWRLTLLTFVWFAGWQDDRIETEEEKTKTERKYTDLTETNDIH